ncbi:uncharacterized protein RHOBADRAFT_47116 [Rhodotorula graminis WP1]|uniref:Protein kinase domain-containing protein n=1 Tax=Rhodotorula graminis (strain WP1) TaxID=578459 RepID=A0A0P9GH70_RHOGW|nr:uncharacterized protein RHOBADRAFT_47116 [Rhodotorula graminis WP1]KPV72270.1 hypothetical protein RHOBADRAFT_47116 [Rhodotorula graminis WP1]
MALSPDRPPPPPSLPNCTSHTELGQGAFGSVYKALNWTTGETCAVKQIDLRHIPESELPDIMSEIDLLKNLHHPNIVQYRGYARTSTSLYIVLEYCENGSLSAIIKKFGRIPESLVGLYTLQVLQGLLYLHDQGVIHRDIKGSNILATKEGSIKLADFGVATRVGSLPDSSVVGSPYWMAPEVVDQSGASPSSDIWSLGALVVELLTGKPPYHHLDPMPALFRIVNDPDGPPLPPGASAGVRDFLAQCFQKDGNLRVGARKLLRHPWMVAAKRQADAQREESDAREAAARATNGDGGGGGGGRGARAGASGRGNEERDERTSGAARPASTYEDEVRVVKEWNEALRANPAAPRAPTALPAPRLPLRPRGAAALAHPSSSSSSASPHLSAATSPSPSTAPSPAAHSLASALLHPSSSSSTAALPALAHPSSSSTPLSLELDSGTASLAAGAGAAERDSDSDNWDSDFEEGISVGKIHAVAASPAGSASEASARAASSEEDGEGEGAGEDGWQGNSLTIRPNRPVAAGASRGKAGAAGGAGGVPLGQIVEDYSDLLGGEEDGEGGRGDAFALRVSSFKAKSAARPQLLRPSDLVALSHSALSSPASSPPQPVRPGHSRTPSAIEKYTEHDEDDYDEVFAGGGASWGRSGVETDGSLKLNTRLSSRSWLGDEDSDEDDPFALDDASSLSVALADAGSGADAGLFEYSAADLERDQLARQCALVGELVETVSGAAAAVGLGGGSRRERDGDGPEVLEAALQLVGLLEDSLNARAHFLKCHGVLVILEALRVARSREGLSVLLRVVNLIVGSDPSTLEKVALIGGCPVVVSFASRRFPREIRLEAALFIGAMCRTSLLTLQMFVSCQGLRTLVEMLDEDYEESKDLIWMAVDGVCRVFEMNGPTPRNDFCRILTQEGLLDPLSNALLAVCGDPDDLAESAKAKIVHVLLLFAQSDHKVKEAMARRSILVRLVKAANVLEPDLLAILLKTVKNLSMLPAALDPLQQAGTIGMLVSLLGQTYRGRLGAEIQNHAVNALFNLCRLSKARQAEAAAAGAIPLLQQIVRDNSPLKQFALPVLCDCAHAGKATRRLLWQHDGMALYLRLLTDAFWVNPALEAILVWLQDEPIRVGQCLLEQTAVDALVRLFCRTKSTVFDNLLEPLHKILRTSPVLAASLAVQSGFLKRLVERLERASKALVRLNLLRITKTVYDSLAAPSSAMADGRRDRDKAVRILDAPVSRIARDDKAVLSRQLARSLVAEFEASRDEARRALARGGAGGAGPGAAALGRRASARRSVSESAAGTVPVVGGSRRGGGAMDSPSSSFASRRHSRTPSTLGTSAPASAPASTSVSTARRPRLDAVVDGQAPSTPARRREL